MTPRPRAPATSKRRRSLRIVAPSLVLAWIALALAAGCRTPTPPGEVAPSAHPTDAGAANLREQLVPSEQLRPEIHMRQRLRFIAGERSGQIDAVVQLTCGELIVVGLTPIGTRLFSIRQQGREVDAQLMMPGSWPFEPERVLLSLQRSLLFPLPVDPGEASGPDGTEEGIWTSRERFGIALQERWVDGRLMERRIPEKRTEGSSVLVIRYSAPGLDAQTIPAQTLLESTGDGYRIEIETLEQAPLECAPGPA